MKDTTVSCSLVLCLALGAASGVHAADKKKAASPAAAAGQAMKDTAGQAVQQAQAQLGQAVSTKVNATLGAVPAAVPGAQAAGNGPATAASGSPTHSSAAPKANLGQQLKQQATQAVTAGVGQALAPASPGKGGVADQARAQASQLVVDQVNARVAGGKAPDTSTLGKQVQGQAAQVAGTVAADQIGKLFTPANGNANANGNGGGLRAQAGAQVSQTLGSALTQSLSGNRANGSAVAQDLRKGLGQSAANAVAAPVAQKLGGAVPTSSSQFVNTLQQGLQQGVQQNLSAQLQKRAGVSGAPSAPALQESLQGAATQAVQQQLTQAVQGTTGSPLAGDLLILGLKRANVDVPTNAGTFAPPAGSALPVDTQNLRSGVSILTNANGQAGLGVKSSVDVGSQTVEISGAVDPNSNSAQGPSAGVQIKIGGN